MTFKILKIKLMMYLYNNYLFLNSLNFCFSNSYHKMLLFLITERRHKNGINFYMGGLNFLFQNAINCYQKKVTYRGRYLKDGI